MVASVSASASTSGAASLDGGGGGNQPPAKRIPRIIRRKKKDSSTTAGNFDTNNNNDIPAHIKNNDQLHHIIATTLPADYEFEIPKTIWRIEKSNAQAIALQLPEGLTMYASTIGDILLKFAYRFMPHQQQQQQGGDDGERNRPKEIKSLSILGDVTYGACCIDDLSARALGCDLLVHYGHSCLVPLTCTVIPCLYVFVEIRVDVQHLVECVKLTFAEEEKSRSMQNKTTGRIIEALVLGTVQFRSAVVESAQKLDGSSSDDGDTPIRFEAIVPQVKPLSPGEVLGCTAPSGLAQMNYQEALSKTRRRLSRKGHRVVSDATTSAATVNNTIVGNITRDRVMIFLADGRFHLEAAMISNPSLRALRYDPYSKTLTEERYEIVKMKKIRRDAILSVRQILGISPPTQQMDIINGKRLDPVCQSSDDIANSILLQEGSSHLTTKRRAAPITMGIILGTLGRQGNPAILSRIRTLLQSHGIRSIILLLSEIFPKKLAMMSNTTPGSESGSGGVCAWVQIACPRLSIDWGHYFCVPVLSPFELFVALGEVADPSLWVAKSEGKEETANSEENAAGYPMDFYSQNGGAWTNYYDSNKDRKIMSYGT